MAKSKQKKIVPTGRKLTKKEANLFLTKQVTELQKSVCKHLHEVNYLRAVNLTLANELAQREKFSFKKFFGLK